MTATEYRRMDTYKVRQACIDHEWYVIGDNEDYEVMLNKCASYRGKTSEWQTSCLYEIATDIFENTDPDLGYYGFTKEEYIAHIMFVLANECMTLSYEVE